MIQREQDDTRENRRIQKEQNNTERKEEYKENRRLQKEQKNIKRRRQKEL